MKNYESRPYGGLLPMPPPGSLPGLVRYDEVAAGAIHHAIRFTMQQTKTMPTMVFRRAASHAAGTSWASLT